jgi:hypothetical protein
MRNDTHLRIWTPDTGQNLNTIEDGETQSQDQVSDQDLASRTVFTYPMSPCNYARAPDQEWRRILDELVNLGAKLEKAEQKHLE